ncbi:MAG: hypothetical protein QOE70_5683 [Chthoniobacter sp.]|jgi:hypothetical protein|nr:hypothetical protein [Chthoniobacter sp.]
MATAIGLFPSSLHAQDAAGPAAGVGQTNGPVSTATVPQIPATRFQLIPPPTEEVPFLPGPPGPMAGKMTARARATVSPDRGGLSGEPSAGPALLRNFQGLTYTGRIPPDPILAVGPGHVIAAVNSSFSIYSKSGTLQFTTTFGSWWTNLSPPGDPFSPKVVYDPNAGRWILLALSRDSTSASAYLLSVSDDSDPNGNWWSWKIDAGLNGDTASGFWADFPGLGYDSSEAVYLTSNQYSFADAFQYARLRILYKSQLYWNGAGGTLGWWDFWNQAEADGTPVFAFKPAQAGSSLNGNYLINTRSGGGDSVTLWRLTNPLASPPTLTRQATVPIDAYTAPTTAAAQAGGAETLAVGDCRTQEVQYRGGKLVTAFTEKHNWGSADVSAIRTLVLDAASSAVDLDIPFGADNLWYYYPAMIRDGSGHLALVFHRSGASEFAHPRYSARLVGDTAWQSSVALKTGEAYYVNKDSAGRNRWGDSSGAALDPSDTSRVWICGEYAKANNQWSTWIGEIPLGSSMPANDSFASATVLIGLTGQASGTNLSATKQAGEPNHAGNSGGASIWWQWTAPAAGPVVIDTFGSGFDTLLAVYTGNSVGGLTEIQSNDDSSGSQSQVAFTATLGATYRIAVDGYNSGSGPAAGSVVLNWNLAASPNQEIRIAPLSLDFVQSTNPQIYVEIDWMETAGHSHRPSQAVIDRIKDAFAREGFVINIDVSNAIPHQDVLAVTNSPWSSAALQSIRNQYFDHAGDRRYYYSIWGHNYSYNGQNTTSSGIADLPGHLCLVSLGSFPGQTGTSDHQVGTFIHEFGHNLGQKHGGSDHENYKPNYLSVMNYHFQLGGIGPTLLSLGLSNTSAGFNDFGYSHGTLADLNENNLNENVGIGLGRAVDWNGNGTTTEMHVAHDLQAEDWTAANGSRTIISDFDNWSNLVGNIQSGALAPAARTTTASEPCIGWEEYQRQVRLMGRMRAALGKGPEKGKVARTAAAGISNAFVIYNDGGSNLAIDAITPETAAPWISWSPAAPFTIPAGGSQTVTVSVNHALAPTGQVSRRLLITSNDADESPYPGGMNINTLTTQTGAVVSTSVSPAGSGTTTGAGTYSSGDKVTVTAVANSGYSFVNWAVAGAQVSNSSKYTFTVVTNRDLVANFVPTGAHSFHGLIQAPTVTQATSGAIRLTLSPMGTISGRLLYGGHRYSLKGEFDPAGTAVVSVERRDRTALRLDFTQETDGTINGTLADDGATIDFALNRAPFDAKTNPASQHGAYTVLCEPEAAFIGDGAFPQGFGSGALLVKKDGALRCVLVLGDGTKVSQGSMVTEGGKWPLYIAAYRKRGAVIGEIAFESRPQDSDANGKMHWFKPKARKGMYAGGFDITSSFLCSRYQIEKGIRVLKVGDVPNNVRVDFNFGNLPSDPPPIYFTLETTNKAGLSGTDFLKVALRSKSGAFSGKFRDSADNLHRFIGFIFQQRQKGFGVFKGDDQTGSALLEPAP